MALLTEGEIYAYTFYKHEPPSEARPYRRVRLQGACLPVGPVLFEGSQCPRLEIVMDRDHPDCEDYRNRNPGGQRLLHSREACEHQKKDAADERGSRLQSSGPEDPRLAPGNDRAKHSAA